MSQDTIADGWRRKLWADGNEIVYRCDALGSNTHDLTIERVIKPNTRRPNWTICRRNRASSGLYPKAIAGPFPSLEAAKAALLILVA